MKKIGIITPFLANGGAERVAITGAEWLREHFDITLIVMDSFQVDYPYDGKLIDINVSLMDRNIVKRMYNIALSVMRLRQLKRVHRFDLVISHGELANLPNILSGGKNNIVTVHENRFAALKDMQGKIVNKLIRYLYSFPNVTKIVTVSEGIRQSMIGSLGLAERKIQTIYNPYAIGEIRELSESPNEFTEMFCSCMTIATAGRLTFAKGQWFLLRIFHALKKTNPNLKLAILGDGEMKEKLIAFSEKLGLKTYTVWSGLSFKDDYDVYFMGFQKNPYQYIKNAKLFVMTSLWEGFGGTIVEAMACGTPVLSTNCLSGPGEIIHPDIQDYTKAVLPDLDGFGLLLPNFKHEFIDPLIPLDEAEKVWIEGIEKLLRDQEKQNNFIQKGFERAESFGREIIMQQWEHLIDTSIKSSDIRQNVNSI